MTSSDRVAIAAAIDSAGGAVNQRSHAVYKLCAERGIAYEQAVDYADAWWECKCAFQDLLAALERLNKLSEDSE